MQQKQFHKKMADLANLKSDVYKLYIGKLKNVPKNLSNLKSKAYKLDCMFLSCHVRVSE